MKKRIIWVLAIIIVIALTQVGLVKLVYAHKLSDNISNIVALVYNLKAGELKNDAGGFKVYLKDYFEHKFFVEKFIDKQLAGAISGQPLITQEPTPEELKELVWLKILKDAWLEKIAQDNDISVMEEDLKAYFESYGGEELLKQDISEYGISYEQYKRLVVDYYILEAKIQQYFLATYADKISAQKAQEAYALLEAENGENFDEVVKNYSDDKRYSENSIFLTESELVGYYAPIRDLQEGDFSKIVTVPGAYAIWKLNSILEDADAKVWEIRGVFISTQTMDEFLNEYLAASKVEKLY